VDTPAQPFLRITGAQLTELELAAVTAVLLARVRAAHDGAGEESGPDRPLAHWHQRRPAAGYRSPVSWR